MANFYWSGMRSDVNRYVQSCLRCQSAKENRQARLGEPTALTVPQNAWDVVHLDWITGLPKSPDGSDAILVMIDSLTGMLHLAACKKEDDSRKTAADELADAIFSTITHTRDEVEKARRKYEREMRKGRKVSQKLLRGIVSCCRLSS